MITSFHVKNNKVTFIEDGGRLLIYLDLWIPYVGERPNEISYKDVDIRTSGGTIKKIVICPTEKGAFICNAVAEVDEGSRPSPEEVYLKVLSELSKVA